MQRNDNTRQEIFKGCNRKNKCWISHEKVQVITVTINLQFQAAILPFIKYVPNVRFSKTHPFGKRTKKRSIEAFGKVGGI